jgi:hypothetical protein
MEILMPPADAATPAPIVPPPILPAPQQWEYLTHVVAPKGILMIHLASMAEITDALAAHGAQGWELASTMVQQYHQEGAYCVVLIFKRPKQAE